jgi:flagellar motility protein MotE (MotC chaperone)
MKILSKIRFLPITIFFASMMLSIKVSHIWDGIEELNPPSIIVAGAVAQTSVEAQQDPEASEKPETETLVTPKKPLDLGKLDPNIKQSRLAADDPTLLTNEEIELLQHLTVRREAIVKREQELGVRDVLLQAAVSRIDKKVIELKNLQKTIDGLIQKFDAQQDAKLLSLVKIYENMKPKDAANIFEDLEMETLLEVAERMKERKLAPVMAKMNPEKAREMTVELRQLRNLPRIGS